jgi:hypothetical protein
MSEPRMGKEFPDTKQRAAVCFSKWKNKGKEESAEENEQEFSQFIDKFLEKYPQCKSYFEEK